MSASPEFFKPAAAPAFSPSCATQPPLPLVFADDYDYDCKTPMGSGISYIKVPTTCPPAPRKPPPPSCKKRLFQTQPQEGSSTSSVPLISLRLDELERIFRPPRPQPTSDAAPAPSPATPPTNAAQLEFIIRPLKLKLKMRLNLQSP